jgi:DNA-directed RNA polymerase subunit beta'
MKNEKNKNHSFSQAKTSIQLWEKRLTPVSPTEKSEERFKKEQLSQGSIASSLGEKSKFGNTNLVSFASEEVMAPREEKMFSNKNGSVQKKFLKGYSKVHELKLVSIGLASPEKIQSWAEKELPNGKIFGEVTNANTFHYRTFQPTKGGLFCERIFGPLKDFECACGKRQKPTALESKKILEHKQTTRYFCSNCDVEYTWSILRRYQLGYIQFNAPVTHLWYLKTNPSSLSLFFDMKRKDLESVVYCIDSLTLENMWKLSQQKGNFSGQISDLFQTWQNSFKYDQSLQNVEKRFSSKKRKKKNFRETFFENSFFSKDFEKNEFSKKRSKNWSLVEKNSFFIERKKPGFSIFKENFEKNQFFGSLLNNLGLCNENSFQPQIVQRVF